MKSFFSTSTDMKKFLLLLALSPVLCSAMTAKSYIVVDNSTGQVVASSNADEQRSIASITKLYTAERNAALAQDELITITAEDVRCGKMRSSPLRAGMQVSRAALMRLALVSSDNIAALALGRSDGPVVSRGPHTTIVEASGLDAGNRSTARELSEMARSLLGSNLALMSTQPNEMFNDHLRKSTNPFIDKPGWNFALSKTGFTNPAGGCLVVVTQIAGKLMTVVILGARDTHQRWRDLVEIRKQLGDSDFYEPVTRTVHAIKTKFRRHH